MNRNKKICIIGIIIGMLIIGVGGYMYFDNIEISQNIKEEENTSQNYYISPASFGADFYTYVYEGIRENVNALNAINRKEEKVIEELKNIHKGQIKIISSINRASAIIIILFGILVVLFFGTKFLSTELIKAEFKPDEKEPMFKWSLI